MAEDSVDVVRGVYEAFGRGDAAAVLGAMADDVEWHEAEGMPTAASTAAARPSPRTCWTDHSRRLELCGLTRGAHRLRGYGGRRRPLRRYRTGDRQGARPPGGARLGCA